MSRPPEGRGPSELLDWLRRLAMGDLTTRIEVDEHDESLAEHAELFTRAQRRWLEERQNVLGELVTALQQITEFRDRELALLAEREQMQRELLAAEREQAQAKVEAQLSLAARMAAVGTLAAGVAHEINNPLTYVIGNLDYLREQLVELRRADATLGAALGEVVAETRAGAIRIKRIVRDLKIFSRADDEDRRATTDVRPVLDSSIALVGNEIYHRARLVKDYGAVPPVIANESRLAQVFVNLLVNAAHAIPLGDAANHEIRISTRTSEHRVVVEIRDTGDGIAAENLGRVFEPFFTTKPRGVGTGLGLSICHGLVQAMDGTITVDSRAGEGAAFRVSLPAAARAMPTVAANHGDSCCAQVARILVVDDNRPVAESMRRALSGHDVVIALDGRQALEQIERDPAFDVVFCDVMMPELTGPEVYERLAESHPELCPRFVFVTGGAFTAETRSFIEGGEIPCITKPFTPGDLRRMVGRVIGDE